MHTRSLRLTLAIAFIFTLYFAYAMLFTSQMLLDIYDLVELDAMHRYLSMVGGSLLVVIAIATALAFLQPIKYVNLIIVLILYHLARFVVDLILIAQGNTSWNILVPEMVYFLVVCGALIRFFPSKAEKVIGEEKPKEDVVSNIEDNSAGN
ncbi:MAG: hypothetical protein QF755_03315 [Candidatus Peribacteraceae bacterium]|jgi:hypothetical protein|nr:hypothetical protein [Candidatus Peribacteraceae bacterium]|tara:strand:- start:1160 stop:1612 length:453 start_codon:yes stop_codon:yes gene_type:complete